MGVFSMRGLMARLTHLIGDIVELASHEMPACLSLRKNCLINRKRMRLPLDPPRERWCHPIRTDAKFRYDRLKEHLVM